MTHNQVQNWKKLCYLLRTYQSHKAYVPELFNVCKSHVTAVDKNLKHYLQFMILTYLLPWNKVKVIKPDINW